MSGDFAVTLRIILMLLLGMSLLSSVGLANWYINAKEHNACVQQDYDFFIAKAKGELLERAK